MSKLFLILFILATSQFLFAQENEIPVTKKIQGSKELPLELNLLIESLQNITNEEQASREKILPIIMNIDSYARALNKEDIFLVGKIEIYKTLLKTNDFSPKATIDGDSLKTLKEAIKKSNDPFITWFLEALLHDCESLISTATYKDYVLQKNNGRLEKIEYRKIDRKVQLLYRWISKLNPDSPEFMDILRANLAPVMMESLKNIEESFFLMASSTGSESKPLLVKSPEELKFFTLKEIKKIKKAPKKEKTVDDILAPITDETKSEEVVLPEPSKEDWLNEDNAPLNLKNLPKPSDDSDWLQDF